MSKVSSGAPAPPVEPVHVVLRDGRGVDLRSVRSTDARELVQAFERLSAHSRYMRFMHAVRYLDPGEVREMLARFPEQGLAMVATIPAEDGIDIVGGASFVVGADREACEFAITVVDSWQGIGLGKQLMLALIDAARQRGLRWMEGYVLATNRPMLQLAQRLGFQTRLDPQDYTIRVVRLDLQPRRA